MYSQEFKNDIIQQWLDSDSLTVKQIAEINNINYSTVKSWFQKKGISTRRNDKTMDYLNAENYWLENTSLNMTEVAKIFKLSRTEFGKRLQAKGYDTNRKRKWHFNEQYFDMIDSEEKNYILGFFAADGCLIKESKNGNSRGIDFTLQYSDKELLEKICKALQLDPSIIVFKEVSNSWMLRISSVYLAKQLEILGFSQRKSLTLDFNNISFNPDFLRAFIYGYFDGDGCISSSKVVASRKIPHIINFTGTFEVCNFIKEYFIKNCNVSNGTLTKRHSNTNNNYTITWQGNNQCYNIAKHLLEYNGIFLKRKREKLKNFIEYIDFYHDHSRL